MEICRGLDNLMKVYVLINQNVWIYDQNQFVEYESSAVIEHLILQYLFPLVSYIYNFHHFHFPLAQGFSRGLGISFLVLSGFSFYIWHWSFPFLYICLVQKLLIQKFLETLQSGLSRIWIHCSSLFHLLSLLLTRWMWSPKLENRTSTYGDGNFI